MGRIRQYKLSLLVINFYKTEEYTNCISNTSILLKWSEIDIRVLFNLN